MNIFKSALLIIIIITYSILNFSCRKNDFSGDKRGDITWITPHQVPPIGKVAFARYFGALYGFDDWRNRKISNNPKISYVSVATDSNTAFCISVGDSLLDAYDSVVAFIPTVDTNKLSFNKIVTTNRIKLSEGYNPIHVYPLTGAASGDSIEIYVHGYYGLSDTVCLAGVGLGSEDRLKVVVCPAGSSQQPVPGISNYYDQNGRLIRSIKISGKYLIYDVMYSYDAKGNRLSSKMVSLKP